MSQIYVISRLRVYLAVDIYFMINIHKQYHSTLKHTNPVTHTCINLHVINMSYPSAQNRTRKKHGTAATLELTHYEKQGRKLSRGI